MNVGIHQIDRIKRLICSLFLESSEVHGFQKHLRFVQCAALCSMYPFLAENIAHSFRRFSFFKHWCL